MMTSFKFSKRTLAEVQKELQVWARAVSGNALRRLLKRVKP